MSTSYLDEAERCDRVFVLREGKLLASGRPEDVTAVAKGHSFEVEPPAGEPARNLQSRLLDDPEIIDAVPEAGRVHFVRAGAEPDRLLSGLDVVAVPARFEDGFMSLLRQQSSRRPRPSALPSPGQATTGSTIENVIEVRDLVRKFGNFTAVDHINFEVHCGEIYSLLGPNGAGKTTTFRMLCGLLPATSGTLRVAGFDLRQARASARQHIGYVAQKFSLYGQLSVAEKISISSPVPTDCMARASASASAWALAQFELEPLMQLPSGQLPGGYKQRLAMATALSTRAGDSVSR